MVSRKCLIESKLRIKGLCKNNVRNAGVIVTF
jgi:hypothetical protein